MKKVLIIFGTRPEAIKMAPLIKAFERHHASFDVKVCITAQHREMLDQVLSIFDITPDYDLNIMTSNQDLYDITSTVLLKLRSILSDYHPDVVLVHGDTTTTLAASLASYYSQIPVGHVEAGLRTYNMYSPWPEEINRQCSDRISTYHFVPTEQNAENLRREQIAHKHIVVTGNTVIDALLMITGKIKKEPELFDRLTQEITDTGYAGLPDLLAKKTKGMILITGHRRENFGPGFIHICEAIKVLSETYPDYDFVYPVHLNPNVQKPVYEMLSGHSNIYLIPPLEYLHFVYLMNQSHLILTDSGGIQEEAPGLGKPVFVMRDTTERPEGIESGTVKLVGTRTPSIVEGINHLMKDRDAYDRMSKAHNPYGDGRACERIVSYLTKALRA